MGTSGLVGVIQTISASTGSVEPWVIVVGVILLLFILPALITWIVGLFFRKIGWIKEGDLALELGSKKQTAPFVDKNLIENKEENITVVEEKK